MYGVIHQLYKIADTTSWGRRKYCETEDYANEDSCQESSFLSRYQDLNIWYHGFSSISENFDVETSTDLYRIQ